MIAASEVRRRHTLVAESDGCERALLEERIGDEYQVVREIGRGGMGVVFLARDIVLHRLVAIKVLRHELACVEEQRERFRREARVTAQLGGDGIVGVHGFDEDGELPYIIMEFVDGSSLAHALAERRPRAGMPHERVRAILKDLALTLHRAHAVGIVHRDLKPENVLLDRRSGRALLTDFGVAISRNTDPVPNTIERAYGTPHFMSPEQSAGQLDLDGRSDLYSLGVIGYLLLTGELPFDSDRVSSIASKHIAEAPVPVRTRSPRVPADLASTVDVCLTKEPAMRWKTGRDLADALSGRTNRRNRLPAVSFAMSAVVGAFDWLAVGRR